MQLSLRPGSSLAMSAHLFPRRLWSWKILISSALQMGSFLMYGSRWLCHLHTKHKQKENLPFSALFAGTITNFVNVLKLVGHVGPALGSVFRHEFANSFVLLHRDKKVSDSRYELPLPAITCGSLATATFSFASCCVSSGRLSAAGTHLQSRTARFLRPSRGRSARLNRTLSQFCLAPLLAIQWNVKGLP